MKGVYFGDECGAKGNSSSVKNFSSEVKGEKTLVKGFVPHGERMHRSARSCIKSITILASDKTKKFAETKRRILTPKKQKQKFAIIPA